MLDARLGLAPLVALGIACAHPPEAPVEPPAPPPPAWLGTRAGPDPEARYFFGLGRAGPDILNKKLRREAAEKRAAQDLLAGVDRFAAETFGREEATAEWARAVGLRALESAEAAEAHQDDAGAIHVRVRLSFEEYLEIVEAEARLENGADAARGVVEQAERALWGLREL